MKKSVQKNKTIWLIAGALIILSVVAYLFWSQSVAKTSEAAEPDLQTAKVRTGDLTLSTSGSGSVISSLQAGLGFRTGGVVSTVNVTIGQLVKKGDILASLENNTQQLAFTQAKASLDSVFSPAGIASYQIELANAQTAYDDALARSAALESSNAYEDELAIRKAAVLEAERNVSIAQANFDYYLYVADDNFYKASALAALAESRLKLTAAEQALADSEASPSALETTKVQADLEIAKMKLAEAQTALDIVQSNDPARLTETLTAADGTALAKLKLEYLAYENALTALENTELIAPFDGVVIALDLVSGQTVGSNPAITLSSQEKMQVMFYMDETDLPLLSVGSPVIYTFDAYPDAILEGEVVSIEPAVQNIEGSPVLVAWGSVPEQQGLRILLGMTVDVEIIAGEAKNALIIPVQALRELSANSYAVFVVQTDGSLKFTPVTIGLKDFANAVVLSGLKVGDVVSTGTVETK